MPDLQSVAELIAEARQRLFDSGESLGDLGEALLVSRLADALEEAAEQLAGANNNLAAIFDDSLLAEARRIAEQYRDALNREGLSTHPLPWEVKTQ